VGPIAQSVEQRTFNPWVDGSSPSGPTTYSLYSLDFESELCLLRQREPEIRSSLEGNIIF